ncbi:LytR/AlgR family response regulator transcription factor [Hyphobacterium sp.]|uniref:LytR/AlgR family response regulator transcription factor n=1 Tax=Hyphobacterium sp. TaxID=2004662 RepID=UPI003B520085
MLIAEDIDRATIWLTRQIDTLDIPFLLLLENGHSASALLELASRKFVLISNERAQIEAMVARFAAYLTIPSKTCQDPTPATARLPGDIWVRHGYGDLRIALAEIRSISADKDYAIIKLPTTSLPVRVTLSELEEKLDGREFIRIHRSHIVPAQRIKELRNATRHRYQVQLDDGSILPVGKTYWPKLRDQLDRRTLR